MKKRPFYIHTDFAKYMFECFDNYSIQKLGPHKILFKMLTDIKRIAKNRMIIPTYNYDFGKKKIFDYYNDQSQIGSFSEFFRKKYINKRSVVPFFSDCSNFKREKKVNAEIFPLGEDSTFNYLFKNSGKIVFFGVDFSPTYLHFIETKIKGGPLYRYDKNFVGKIIINKKKILNVNVKMHVIPRGLNINYDLKKIERDLKKKKILKIKKLKKNFFYLICDVKQFHRYATKKLKKDPYYFLEASTKKVLLKSKILQNRRFDINDFEKS